MAARATQAELEAAVGRARARVLSTSATLEAMRPEATVAALPNSGRQTQREAWDLALKLYDGACAEYVEAVRALFDGMAEARETERP